MRWEIGSDARTHTRARAPARALCLSLSIFFFSSHPFSLSLPPRHRTWMTNVPLRSLFLLSSAPHCSAGCAAATATRVRAHAHTYESPLAVLTRSHPRAISQRMHQRCPVDSSSTPDQTLVDDRPAHLPVPCRARRDMGEMSCYGHRQAGQPRRHRARSRFEFEL